MDLVSHSGSNAEGDFIHSLNCTDIHTTWTETRTVMGKGQDLTLDAIIDIKNSLPFTLRGIDSDNGSEFINYAKQCKSSKGYKSLLYACRQSYPYTLPECFPVKMKSS